jgi:hypothetical protein
MQDVTYLPLLPQTLGRKWGSGLDGFSPFRFPLRGDIGQRTVPSLNFFPYCGRVERTAAETVQVYSEYLTAYILGMYNTVQVQVLGIGRCVRRDSSDLKYASKVLTLLPLSTISQGSDREFIWSGFPYACPYSCEGEEE